MKNPEFSRVVEENRRKQQQTNNTDQFRYAPEKQVILQFEKSGNLLALLSVEAQYKVQPWRFNRIMKEEYNHDLQVIRFEDNGHGIQVHEICHENEIFVRNYLTLRARSVFFLTSEDLAVIFDSEIVIIKTAEPGSKSFVRVSLISQLEKSVYKGDYMDHYVFTGAEETEEKFKLNQNVEFVRKTTLLRIVGNQEVRNEVKVAELDEEEIPIVDNEFRRGREMELSQNLNALEIANGR